MKTTKPKLTISEFLAGLGACCEARQWAEQFRDPQTAWNECKRGDWMLWLLGRMSGPPGSDSRKAVVFVACQCARLTLSHFEARYPEDKRPRAAIETAEHHCLHKATLKEVRAASNAANAAANAANAAAAAAYAAANAASAAANTAAYAAAAAANTAAYAANDDAAAANARTKCLAECAEIVRKHFPIAPAII